MKTDAGTAGAALASAGAATTATAAVACCVPVLSPLLVAALGASGAVWVTGLAPYAPYLLAGGLALLAYAFRRVYGPGRGCEVDGGRETASPWLARLTLGLLWVAALAWVAGVVAYIAFT